MKVVVSYVATFKICPKNTSELESQPLMQNTFGVNNILVIYNIEQN